MICSDSSMDDCNYVGYKCGNCGKPVQIPLWTIVTESEDQEKIDLETVQIPLWTIVTINSVRLFNLFLPVQIPLWTIVTLLNCHEDALS